VRDPVGTFELEKQERAMAFLDLREWIQYLKEQGQLHTVDSEVDIRYDIPRILDEDDGQKAVLFENVSDYFPTRVFGGSSTTRAQMAAALGVPQENLLKQYLHAVESPIQPIEIAPGEAPVLEVHESEVRVDLLPAPWHHEKDSGKFITAAITIAKDQASNTQNWSIHRSQVNDASHVATHLVPRHLWRIFAGAEEQGKDLPIALVLGLPPGYLLASQAVTAFGVDEAGIAGGLLHESLPVVRSPRYGIQVPANAEHLLEGRILARQRGPEGPFGEFPRTYGVQTKVHQIEIDEIFHRTNAIYQTILPASQEHMLLGSIPREASIYDCVRRISSSIRDVVLTFAGGGRFHAVISMSPTRPGESRNVLLAAFAGFNEVKRVVIVDEDIDPSNPQEVEWAMAMRVQPARDVMIFEDMLGSKLDPSARDSRSSKWGIDATIPVGENREGYERIQTPQRAATANTDHNGK
jgi:2,5-furandicarboxylate decarboxylase 1